MQIKQALAPCRTVGDAQKVIRTLPTEELRKFVGIVGAAKAMIDITLRDEFMLDACLSELASRKHKPSSEDIADVTDAMRAQMNGEHE